MKTKTWVPKPSAGPSTSTVISVQAVQLTSENLEEVLAWCGGVSRSKTSIFVPAQKPVGDTTNPRRSVRLAACQVPASVTDYVVQWNGLFYVVSEATFTSTYDLA